MNNSIKQRAYDYVRHNDATPRAAYVQGAEDERKLFFEALDYALENTEIDCMDKRRLYTIIQNRLDLNSPESL